MKQEGQQNPIFSIRYSSHRKKSSMGTRKKDQSGRLKQKTRKYAVIFSHFGLMLYPPTTPKIHRNNDTAKWYFFKPQH